MFEEHGGLIFSERFLSGQILFHVSSIAKLGGDEDGFIGGEIVNIPNHVFVFAFFEYFDFGFD